MWIYPDEASPEGYKPKMGEIVIITRSEFGETERQVGVVMHSDDFGDAVDVMILQAEHDGWILGG